MRVFVILLKKMEVLSALSMRLVKLTGKSNVPMHPKHLIKTKIWFEKYLTKNDTVLDFGCGIGQAAIIISRKVRKVIGLDNDPKSLKLAKASAQNRNLKNVEFIIFDANKKLPFKNNYVDKVICSDVLEHLEKRNFALGEIRRVLKPQGVLFLVVDNPSTSWKRLQKSAGLFYYADPDHKYEYPKEAIMELLKKEDFKILHISTVTYDTPLKGLIDLTGGLSLSLYKKLRKWRQYMVKKHPEDTTGYKIVAQKN